VQVLLVEDDEETAAFIERGLLEAGHSVTHDASANDGLISAAAKSFDVIVFDRLLPGMDGVDAVRVLRQSGVTTPILLLTALDGIDDRVKGLEAGADDYLVKPFAFAELYARLRALARRQPLVEETQRRQIADLVLERTTQLVTRAGQRLELLPREYRILDYLMAHEGQVVTRTMLLETIWGFQFDPKTSLVQTHVSRLRNKVDKPFAIELIHTVRGAGYVISAPG
jgi:two-component system OmpR family response regulator